jgi:hypothetical protein
MKENNVEKEPMGKSTKYTALDHGGLEVVPSSDAPEVIVDGAFDSKKSVNRRSSLLVPEAFHAAPHYADNKAHYSYYGPNENDAPEHYDTGVATFVSPEAKEAHVAEQELGSGKDERRYCCGLKRRGLIILIAGIILLVVVLGAVLGGVLGTQLAKG